MYKLFRRLKNKKGFTLIELIIVVAIVAVLAAVGIPAIAGQLGRSVQATAQKNARLLADEGQRMIEEATARGTLNATPPTLADSASTQISVALGLDKTDAMVQAFCSSAGVNIADTAISVTVDVVPEMDGADIVGYNVTRVVFAKGSTTGTFSRS